MFRGRRGMGGRRVMIVRPMPFFGASMMMNPMMPVAVPVAVPVPVQTQQQQQQPAANYHTEMPKEAGRRRTKEEIRKKKKDPNAPKRALSAYMYFANEQRDNVRSENPDITFGQIGKVLGEKWKALTDSQKAPYEAKATQDKKRYEEEKAAYNASKAQEFSE